MITHTLVWAKMKYCPWWPGLVRATIPQIKKKKGEVKFIFFFGSRDFAWIEDRNLKPYVEFRQLMIKPKRSRRFYEAVDRIEEYISDPVKYKVNVEQEFVPKPSGRKAPRKLKTIKKNKNKKATPVTSHRYPTRYIQKTNQLNRPASPLPMRPNESPIFMETISQSISNFNLSLKFGVLGLETMGRQIAENLIHSGHEVFVFDKYTSHMVGAKSVSPSELIDNAAIIFSCISDPLILQEIFFDNCGLRKSLTVFKEKGFVQMMCLNDKMSREIAKGLVDNGGRYLEAQVHGSKYCAEPGSLIVLAAGDRKLFDECQMCLNAIGQNVFFFGKAGNAAKMYLVLQMILGISTAGLAEGMALATKFSLPRNIMLDIMKATNMISPLLSKKAKAIMFDDFPVQDTVRDTEKDLRLAIALGDKLEQPMPLTATANEMYVRARRVYPLGDSSSVFMQLMH